MMFYCYKRSAQLPDLAVDDMAPHVRSIAHQTSGSSELAKLEDPENRVVNRHRGKLFASAIEVWIAGDYEPTGSQLDLDC